MTEDEKQEILYAIGKCVGEDWSEVGIFTAIEPIIKKIAERNRLEGATTTAQSLIG